MECRITVILGDPFSFAEEIQNLVIDQNDILVSCSLMYHFKKLLKPSLRRCLLTTGLMLHTILTLQNVTWVNS